MPDGGWNPLVYLAIGQAVGWALTGLVLGLLYWHRGRLLSRAEYRECNLRVLVGQLERAAKSRDDKDQMEGLSNADAIADFDQHDPVVFDDTGEG